MDVSTEDKIEGITKLIPGSTRTKRRKVIQSTVELLVSHDKKELLNLLKDFRDEVDEDFFRNLE